MPNTVMRVQYFYTEVPDKPGEGAKILNVLEEARVTLLAYSGFPKGRRSQLDFIPADVTARDAVGAGEGRYGAMLWVKPQEVQKAAKVLGASKEERPKAKRSAEVLESQTRSTRSLKSPGSLSRCLRDTVDVLIAVIWYENDNKASREGRL